MKNKTISLIIYILLAAVIFTAGCLHFPSTDDGSSGGSDLDTDDTADTDQDDSTTDTSDSDDSGNTLDQEQSTVYTQVVSYLQANPESKFGEQVSRLRSVEIIGNTPTLEYTRSEISPSAETQYFTGVLLIVFSEYDMVEVSAYTSEGEKLLSTSGLVVVASSPSKVTERRDYMWEAKYFTEAEIAAGKVFECTDTADCDDGEDCTIDGCFSNRCSHVWTNSQECQLRKREVDPLK